MFGLEMGTGARTYSTTHLPHVALLWAVALAPVGALTVVGAGLAFGAGRAAIHLGTVVGATGESVVMRQRAAASVGRATVAPLYASWAVALAVVVS